MVGRTVRAAMYRLCGIARGSLRICGSRRGFRAGRRFHLGRSARRGGSADGRGANHQASVRRNARKSQSRTGIAREMKILRPISILASCLLLTAGAAAQISLTPPGAETPPAASKPAAKPKAKPPEVAKKPAAAAATPKPAAPPPAPTAKVTPAPAPDDPSVDLVFGAYQRGQYKTAFDLAPTRAHATRAPHARTVRRGGGARRGTSGQPRGESGATMPGLRTGTGAPPTAAPAKACSRSPCF